MVAKSLTEPFVAISLLNSLMNSDWHNNMQMLQKFGLTHSFTALIYCPTRNHPPPSSTVTLGCCSDTLLSILFLSFYLLELFSHLSSAHPRGC